jgi:FixJ family two-component response regulator
MIKNNKVIVIDDEPIVRSGLENWLSHNYQVSTFDSAETFLNAFNQFEFEDGIPTCILLDFQMANMNGVELQNSLKSLNAEFPIIFMSGNAQQADIIDAWRGGAVDFILKPFTPTQVTDALNKHFSILWQSEPIKFPSNNREQIHIPITKREAEVLLLLGEGYQQHETAQVLGISLRTVKMYRSFLKDKLGLNTLGELIKYCQQYKVSISKITRGEN